MARSVADLRILFEVLAGFPTTADLVYGAKVPFRSPKTDVRISFAPCSSMAFPFSPPFEKPFSTPLPRLAQDGFTVDAFQFEASSGLPISGISFSASFPRAP